MNKLKPDLPVVRFGDGEFLRSSRPDYWRIETDRVEGGGGGAMKLNLPIEMLVSGTDDVRLFLYIVMRV